MAREKIYVKMGGREWCTFRRPPAWRILQRRRPRPNWRASERQGKTFRIHVWMDQANKWNWERSRPLHTSPLGWMTSLSEGAWRITSRRWSERATFAITTWVKPRLWQEGGNEEEQIRFAAAWRKKDKVKKHMEKSEKVCEEKKRAFLAGLASAWCHYVIWTPGYMITAQSCYPARCCVSDRSSNRKAITILEHKWNKSKSRVDLVGSEMLFTQHLFID